MACHKKMHKLCRSEIHRLLIAASGHCIIRLHDFSDVSDNDFLLSLGTKGSSPAVILTNGLCIMWTLALLKFSL